MTKSTYSILTHLLLISIIFAGFIYRLKGISTNHSFWHDEAFAASLARDTLSGRRSKLEAMKLLNYQPLHVLTTAFSMKIFGVNEFAARFPVVLWGTLGILAAYLLAKKLSNTNGGLLTAFLYAFSQLNLAHSTQTKSNTAVQTLFLLNLFFLYHLSKKNNLAFHAGVIITATIASCYHFSGFLNWLPYLTFIILTLNIRDPKNHLQTLIKIVVIALILIGVYFIAGGRQIVTGLIRSEGMNIFTSPNNLTYLRELLWKNYSFITLPAIFGMMLSFRKNRHLASGLIIFILALFYIWIFYAFRNIRYLLPLFALLLVYFAVFWSWVGKMLFAHQKSWFAPLLVAVLIYGGGNKIVRFPQNYYNPNLDLYGDVQIADYKTAFQLIRKKFSDLKERAVFNDWYEAQSFYLPEKKIDAYFLVGVKKPYRHHIDGSMIYGTLEDFLREKSKYKKGILIVEDWQSLLPDEIKKYVKKNMKLEFRVESLQLAKSDAWPIEVYSW